MKITAQKLVVICLVGMCDFVQTSNSNQAEANNPKGIESPYKNLWNGYGTSTNSNDGSSPVSTIPAQRNNSPIEPFSRSVSPLVPIQVPQSIPCVSSSEENTGRKIKMNLRDQYGNPLQTLEGVDVPEMFQGIELVTNKDVATQTNRTDSVGQINATEMNYQILAIVGYGAKLEEKNRQLREEIEQSKNNATILNGQLLEATTKLRRLEQQVNSQNKKK